MLPRSRHQRNETVGRVPCVTVPVRLLDAGLSQRAITMYCFLMSYTDERNQCWPSRATLARRMDCSVPTVDRALGELRDAGIVTVTPRLDRNGSPTTSLFTLAVEPPDAQHANGGA